MTWNTPLGLRTLTGIERTIVAAAIRRMTREIVEESIDDALLVGLRVFDSLTGCQQLVMLDYVRQFLMKTTESENAMTAVVEGTAAAIFNFIIGQIEYELDTEREFRDKQVTVKPQRFWRKQIIKAVKCYEWELDPKKSSDDWELAVELLHDRVLFDGDYDMDFSDGPPEASNAINATFGIPDGYYTSIPFAEPDGPEMLELIRRLLR